MRCIKTVSSEEIFFQEKQVLEGNAPTWQENCMVNVFDDVTYQEILGFGAAFTEAAAYNYSLMDEKNKRLLMQKYFSKEDGIGYNLGRTHINSCDFSLDIYSYVQEGDIDLNTFDIARDKKYIIPFIKDAQKYCKEELFLFASPWSPPAYMKDNNSMIEGGKLKEEYKRLWARYYAKYIKAYAGEGIRISAITVQNEPNAKQRWESCFYTAHEEAEFIEEYLAPELDAQGLSDIKIIIWDHNKERIYDRAKEVLSSPGVSERVWAVGHHWYSGDHFEGLSLVHEQLGKSLICTEFCAKIDADVQTLAERYVKEMCGNFNNFETASCDWNILLSSQGGPYHNRTEKSMAIPGVFHESKDGGCYAPVLYDQEKEKLLFTTIYYYIGHFSKYVQRGAKRISTTKYTDKLSVCGFKNPDGSTAVIIANMSDDLMPVVIRREGVCTRVDLEAHGIQTLLFG